MNDDSNDNAFKLSDPRTWVQQYGDYLLNYALVRVQETSIAEELVQETFLAALKARDGFRGQASERTWLTGILRHKIIDHVRKAVRERESADEQAKNSDVHPLYWHEGRWAGHWVADAAPQEWRDNPSSNLERAEFWAVLEKCLKALPDSLGKVFALLTIDELTTDSACKELGISATNLRVRLYRARHLMRICLDKNWFGRTSE